MLLARMGINMIKKLYHGTNETSAIDIVNNGIDLNRSMQYLDFGKGFYLTDDVECARKRANQKTNIYNVRYKKNDQSAIVVVCYEEDIDINKKIFSRFIHDDDWAKFVIANRLPLYYLEQHNILEHNQDNRYDVVIG